MEKMEEKAASIREYACVYGALLLLLALTLIFSYVDLKGWNTALSLGIAVAKTALVAVYFMHLKQSRGLTRVFAGVGVFWLSILLVLALTDYVSRGWLALPGHWP